MSLTLLAGVACLSMVGLPAVGGPEIPRPDPPVVDSVIVAQSAVVVPLWGLPGRALALSTARTDGRPPPSERIEALVRIGLDAGDLPEVPLDPGISAVSAPDQRQLRGLPPDSLVAGRLALVAGALGATVAGLYVYQRNAWWAEEHRGRFHFQDDGGYTEHLDKVGHFHATYFQSMVVARALRLSGLSAAQSAAYGALAAWLVQLQVEINDGFSELWGFDVYDVVANTVGAAYFYGRERIPALDPFLLKFSYWPSEYLLEDIEKPGGTQSPAPIDDYLGHSYWLSVRVHDLLPESARPVWPRWLMLAGGVSGDRLYTPEQQRSYYLALDVDLERIIPARTWLAAAGLEILNFVKLPTPAIRLHPRPTLYLLYYGQP
jgi:VanZ family protein